MKSLASKSEFYLFFLILILGATFTLANPRFLALQNILDLLKSYSFFGILSVGELVVLLSGGIDISFTAIAQVAEYVTVAVILQYGGNLITATLISCAIGIILGLANGLLIHFLRIPPIITTIATLNLYFGALYVISTGNIIYRVPQFYQDLSNATLPGGVPMVVGLWTGVVIVTGLILRYTLLGRSIYALGGNPAAAERVGFKVLHTRLFVYSFIGLLAGFGSIVHTALVQSAIPNSIVGHELDVLAAVVLGGANIFGGSGSLIGTFMGVGLLAMLGNGLTLMGISSYWNDVVVGCVLLVGVTFSSLQRMRLASRRANVLVEQEGL
jgi:simple sugar transport system permease protein